jgi:hypothetical protein
MIRRQGQGRPQVILGIVLCREGGQKAALQPLFDGPYRIVEVRAKTVLVNVGAEQQWVSRVRVKPYQGTSPPTVAVRKRRGRPRGKCGGRMDGPTGGGPGGGRKIREKSTRKIRDYYYRYIIVILFLAIAQ